MTVTLSRGFFKVLNWIPLEGYIFLNLVWQCSSDYSVENAVGHELGESQHFAVCPSKLDHFGLLPVYCLPCEVRTLHSPPETQHLLSINMAFNTHDSVEVTA